MAVGWPSEEDRIYMVKKIIREKKGFINYLKKGLEDQNNKSLFKIIEKNIENAEKDLEEYIKRNPIKE